MSTINCKDCNKEISSDALSCPHCGAEIGWSPQAITGLVLMAIVAGLFMLFVTC
jgi:hypothetical protein